jgi:hypothetical protein
MIGMVALLAVIGLALALVMALATALRRVIRPRDSSGPPASRAECLLRSIPAAMAAALAFVAAARVSADSSYEIGGGLVLVFVVAGIASTIVAVSLVVSGLPNRAIYLAGTIAMACAILLLASAPITFARSACACTSSGIPYVPPTLAGLDAVSWSFIAAVGTPVLLLVAFVRRPYR